ncbi:MAG: efflux transporter outer membrane subunit [Parachlamydia sp.]|nr:efflux transporter outer membrane subunit [Parachlamydia sp.]
MTRNRYFCRLILCAVFLTGCGTGRRAVPIESPAVLDNVADRAIVEPVFARGELPEDWWNLFADGQLTNFIEKAFAQHPTLQSAKAKILSAAYSADLTRSSLFPNLTWGGDISRQKLSETGLIPFNTTPTPVHPAPIAATGGQNNIPVYFTQYETELILTYDFDLWGKNRNLWRAGLGEVRVRMADEAFVRLQLGISIAEVYYQLQIAYKRQQIAQAVVDNQASQEELTHQRVQANLGNRQELFTAKTNTTSAKQTLLELEGEIAVYENQLHAYLAGDFEEPIEKVGDHPLPQIPLPNDLPVHLLAHRPDIAAQLWLIESGGRQIEAAKAGFYPDFNLAALFGYQTLHLRKLFEFPSSMYNIDPAFTLPIFDGGRLLANLRGSEINYDLAVLHYNEMILTASREVLDGIAVLRNSEQQLQEFHRIVGEQEEIFQNSRLRSTWNLNSGLDDLVSEQNVLLARDRETVAYGKKIQAILQLIKALGGGYATSC